MISFGEEKIRIFMKCLLNVQEKKVCCDFLLKEKAWIFYWNDFLIFQSFSVKEMQTICNQESKSGFVH